jgi:hypothetical protein
MALRKSRIGYKWVLCYWLLPILFFAALSAPCFACSCRRIRSECQLLDSDTIFVGKVIATSATQHFSGDQSWPGYSMRFTVEESLRGTLGKEVTVETGSGGGDCGTPLDPGTRLLIFAAKSEDGKLWTGLCSGNQLLTDASAIDSIVAPVRKAITAGKGSLFGTVTYSAPQRAVDHTGAGQLRGVPDLLLHAASATETFSARTAKDGTYEFKDLPNGQYTVTPELKQNWTYDDHSFTERYVKPVADGSCANIDFEMHPSTRLRGQITTLPGRVFGFIPERGFVELVKVVAIPTDLQNTNEHSGTEAYTDANGNFDLWPIAPGDYYVGINITSSPKADAPYTPTYYPGVTDIKAARVVHIEEGETKEIEFPLPDFAEKRVVRFVAIGLDGKPLRKVRVQSEDLQHPGDSMNSLVVVDLDTNGAGTMNIYSGFTYHLHASASSVSSRRTTWCAAPVLVSAGSGPVDIRFVMDRSDTEDDRAVTGIYSSPCTIAAMDKAIKDAESRLQP